MKKGLTLEEYYQIMDALSVLAELLTSDKIVIKDNDKKEDDDEQ